MKKQKTVSIKAKLLGDHTSRNCDRCGTCCGCLSDICRTIKKYSQNLLAVFGREPGIPDRSMAE